MSRGPTELECIDSLEHIINLCRSNSKFKDNAQSLEALDEHLMRLTQDIVVSLNKSMQHWKFEAMMQKLSVLGPGAEVLIDVCYHPHCDHNADDLKRNLSNEHDQSKNFSNHSEGVSGKHLGPYVHGYVKRLHWGSVHPSTTRQGPYATVVTKPFNNVDEAEFSILAGQCIPCEAFREDDNDAATSTLGSYILFGKENLFQPVKLVEVTRETLPNSLAKRVYTLQTNRSTVVKIGATDRPLIQIGHPWIYQPSDLYAIAGVISHAPRLIAEALPLPLSSSDSDKLNSRWRILLSNSLTHCQSTVEDLLHTALRHISANATLLISLQASSESDVEDRLDNPYLEITKICRDCHRIVQDMLQLVLIVFFDIACVGGPIVSSEIAVSDKDRVLRHSLTVSMSNTTPTSSMRKAVIDYLVAPEDTEVKSTYSAEVLNEFRAPKPLEFITAADIAKVLKIACTISDVCLSEVTIAMPPPFIIPVKEWAMTVNSLHELRNCHACFFECLDKWQKDGINLYLSKLSHKIIALDEALSLSLDDAIMQAYHTFEVAFVLDIMREDWSSNHTYRRNKRVSAGVVALSTSYASLIKDTMSFLSPHHDYYQKFCVGIISSALRCTTNIYLAISPSRVRAKQYKRDICYSLRNMVCIVRSLLSAGVFREDWDDDGANYLQWLRDTERACMHDYSAEGVEGSTYFLNLLLKQQKTTPLTSMEERTAYNRELYEALLELSVMCYFLTSPAESIHRSIQSASYAKTQQVPESSLPIPDIDEFSEPAAVWGSGDAIRYEEIIECTPFLNCPVEDLTKCVADPLNSFAFYGGGEINPFVEESWMISDTCLKNTCCRVDWIMNVLKKRVELVPSEYPSLTPEEDASREVLAAVLNTLVENTETNTHWYCHW